MPEAAVRCCKILRVSEDELLLSYLAIGLIVSAALVWAWRAYNRYRAFVWRTEDISASIERDDEFLKVGQYLNLNQHLAPEEQGWFSMKINIPESWTVTALIVANGSVKLDTENSGSFALNRRNVGKLSFAILDGGDNKPDDVLHSLWVEHAAP